MADFRPFDRVHVRSFWVAFLLAASPVQAAPWVWNAPEACPAPTPDSSEPLEAPAPPASDAEQTDAEQIDVGANVVVTVTEHDGEWSAVIRAAYAGGEGERVLRARSCSDLNRAVLVALSLLGAGASSEPLDSSSGPLDSSSEPLDSSSGPGGFGLESEPLTAPEPLDRSVSTPARIRDDRSTAPSSPPKSRVIVAPIEITSIVGIALALAGEGAELATIGGELMGALEWHAMRARLHAGVRMPWAPVSADHDIELRLWLLTGRFDLCRGWGTRLVVSGCLGPSLERLAVRAPGISDPQAASDWFPGVGASLGVRSGGGAWLGWATELRVNTRFFSAQPKVEPWGPVYELPPWSIILSAGPEFRL